MTSGHEYSVLNCRSFCCLFVLQEIKTSTLKIGKQSLSPSWLWSLLAFVKASGGIFKT
jgi:hypothetical protein